MVCVISGLRKAATSGSGPLLPAPKSPRSFSLQCQPLPFCVLPSPRASEISSPQGLLSFPSRVCRDPGLSRRGP